MTSIEVELSLANFFGLKNGTGQLNFSATLAIFF